MRVTKLAWVLIAISVAVAVLSLAAPTAGLIAAVVLAVLLLAILSEGVLGEGSQAAQHDAWARVEAERKREALRR